MSHMKNSLDRRYPAAFLLLAFSLFLQAVNLPAGSSLFPVYECVKTGAVVLITACLFLLNRPIAWIHLCYSAAVTVLYALPFFKQLISFRVNAAYCLTESILRGGCLLLCLLVIPLAKKLRKKWIAPPLICILVFFVRWLSRYLLFNRLFSSGGNLYSSENYYSKEPSLLDEFLYYIAAYLLYALLIGVFKIARRRGWRLYRRLSSASRPHRRECLIIFLLLFFVPALFRVLPTPFQAISVGIGLFGIAALYSKNAFYGWTRIVGSVFVILLGVIETFSRFGFARIDFTAHPDSYIKLIALSLTPLISVATLLLAPLLFRLIKNKLAAGLLVIAACSLASYGASFLLQIQLYPGIAQHFGTWLSTLLLIIVTAAAAYAIYLLISYFSARRRQNAAPLSPNDQVTA